MKQFYYVTFLLRSEAEYVVVSFITILAQKRSTNFALKLGSRHTVS